MRSRRPRLGSNNIDTLYIDGMNLAYRSIFSGKALTNSDGKNTQVIYGGLKSIKALIETYTPNKVIFALEGKNSRTRRCKIYPEYKAKRKNLLPIPKEEFYQQVSDLEDLLYNLGVTIVKIDTYEADDVIAVLARANRNSSIIVSTDGDYLQLINEKISVWNPTKEILITEKNFKEQVGVAPMDFLDWKCMVGDKSDAIKGVEGVGEVTATAICNFLGYTRTIEAGVENVDKKWKKIFTPEAREQFKLADRLINLERTELTLEEAESAIVQGVYDEDEVKDLLEDNDMWTMLDHYDSVRLAFQGLDNTE